MKNKNSEEGINSLIIKKSIIVIKDKIYLLCSDDYTVYVYDRNDYTLINIFELDKVGFYNAIKASDDKK